METPTAAMKIFWSWSQQPCSSQFTATILARSPPPPQICLRLEFGGEGGDGEGQGHDERERAAAKWKPKLLVGIGPGRTENVRGAGTETGRRGTRGGVGAVSAARMVWCGLRKFLIAPRGLTLPRPPPTRRSQVGAS